MALLAVLGTSRVCWATTKCTCIANEALYNWKVRLVKAWLFVVPRANYDVEHFYHLVQEWAVELSADGCPHRELELDQTGKPQFAAPDGRNTSF